jgi:hypothetical protein
MFGYLIIISKDKNNVHQYHQMAYLLALSIKHTQKPGYDNVAVVVDDKEIFEIFRASPFIDRTIFWDEQDHWDGRSWMDKLSPWEQTVCLDADMLFLRDYSHWIDHFNSAAPLYVSPKAYTYRGEIITNDYCRKTFTENALPNLYSAYTWFNKKHIVTEQFFDLGRDIIENPTEFKNLFLDKYVPEKVGTDEAFALAAKILDIEDTIAYQLEFPRFVHMKPELQNLTSPITSVDLDLGYYIGKNNKLKIGTFAQTDIFHYAQKDLDIAGMIENYENMIKQGFKNE